MAARAHAMDEVLFRFGGGALAYAAARARSREPFVRRDGRRRHAHDAAACGRNRNYGPLGGKIILSSSSTEDADIFAVLRVFSPDMKEVVFQGAIDPHTPIGQGWLRASHRKLDPALSKPWRPYHTHDELQPLEARRAGRTGRRDLADQHRGAGGLPDRAHDSRQGLRASRASGGKLSNFKNELRGCGPFLHDDLRDRPPQIFGGVTGLHFGGAMQPYLLLPIIPAKAQPAKTPRQRARRRARQR